MPDSIEIVPKEEVTEANKLLVLAKTIHIIDAKTCDQAAQIALKVKKRRCKIESYHRPHIDRLNVAKTEMLKSMKEITEPLKAVENHIKVQIIGYNDHIERLRLEAAEKAQREAEEAARKDQERLDKEALEAVKKGDEEALARAEAEKEMVDPQDHLPVPAPPEKMPQGVSTRANWQAEVTDLPALIRAVMEGHAPKNFIGANEKAIGKYAKATEGTRKIPGVRFYDKRTVTLRT